MGAVTPTPRRVPALNGFRWIFGGFTLVFHSPFGWLKVTTLWFLFSLFCGVIPLMGPLVFSLLFPTLFAGLMTGCQAVEAGRSLTIQHLLNGFRQKPIQPYITLGGFNVLGELLITALLVIWVGPHMAELQSLSSIPDAVSPEQAQTFIDTFTPIFLGIAVLEMLLLVLFLYAPALLIFHSTPPVQSLLTSGKACMINTPAFIANGVGLAALVVPTAFVSFRVPLLGALLVTVLAPTIAASVYVSYRDIFKPHETI